MSETKVSNICLIEKGTQNISLDLMTMIAEALDKDVFVIKNDLVLCVKLIVKNYKLFLYF